MKKIFIFILVCCLFLPTMANAKDNVDTINTAQLLDLITKNKGKIVIINFFATWCPPCREEMPDLVKFNNSMDSTKVVLIGLSLDTDTKPLAPFLEKLKVTYPVYVAAPEVAAMYGVRSIPHNTVYAPSGKMIVNEPGIATEKDLNEFIKAVLEEENKK